MDPGLSLVTGIGRHPGAARYQRHSGHEILSRELRMNAESARHEDLLNEWLLNSRGRAERNERFCLAFGGLSHKLMDISGHCCMYQTQFLFLPAPVLSPCFRSAPERCPLTAVPAFVSLLCERVKKADSAHGFLRNPSQSSPPSRRGITFAITPDERAWNQCV